MIPDIGLVIAVYVVTRLTAMLGQPSEQTNMVAKVFSGIAILVTIVATVDLLQHGVNALPPTRF